MGYTPEQLYQKSLQRLAGYVTQKSNDSLYRQCSCGNPPFTSRIHVDFLGQIGIYLDLLGGSPNFLRGLAMVSSHQFELDITLLTLLALLD